MNYRSFVNWFTGISISLIIVISAALCIIDPLGIFNIVNIKGFNHYKKIQVSYMDVFKPYEIQEKKPDIIFIGSSRVCRSIDPIALHTGDVVYNAGFNTLTLKDMDTYLDMVYKIKKPKKVYIGLDFQQFDEAELKLHRTGFSLERVQNITTKDNIICLYKLKDTIGIGGENIISVIEDSNRNINEPASFFNGYNYEYNKNLKINSRWFYSTFNIYNNIYSKWKYSKRAMAHFRNIVKKAKKNNVELIVYFNPVSIELMNLMRIYKIDDDLEKVKKEVTYVCGIVYDFNFVNKYVTNKKYFMDGSHCNRLYGDIIIKDLKNKKNSKSMLVLTKENVEFQLKKERNSFTGWRKKNSKYYASMEKKLKGNKKVKVGDFKKFIGF